jgi:hypothetical protein
MDLIWEPAKEIKEIEMVDLCVLKGTMPLF